MTGGMCFGPTSCTTSRPEQSGICTSSRTRSGGWVAIAWIASSPEPHSPTTSMSGKLESAFLSPFRINGSSSTTNKRSLLIGDDSYTRRSKAKRKGHSYFRATFWQRTDRERMLLRIHLFQALECGGQPDPQLHLLWILDG